MSNHSPRRAAAQTLADIMTGRSLAAVLPRHVATVDDSARALLKELVYSTLREWPLLEGLGRQLLRKPLRNKDADIHGLIMLGLHQLRGSRIPTHAAVSETVAVCREVGKPWATGLVNGVLRNYQRSEAELLAKLKPHETCALPEWLYTSLRNQWPDHWLAIAEASSHRPPMTLRINRRRTSAEDYGARLEAAGMAAAAARVSDVALTLANPVDVQALPGFADGDVSVQDASAQLAAILLDPQPGEWLLDACAAPGGKSCHLSERQPALGGLIAADNDPQRLEKIIANRDRLELDFDCRVVDAAAPGNAFGEQRFDAILADVPCSATGVLRRNPDIKLHRGHGDIDHFVEQQRAITAGLWPLLKPGGRLLYATCSILQAENDAVIEAMLARFDDALVEPLDSTAGVATRFGRQLLPSKDGGDGLYYSLIRRGT